MANHHIKKQSLLDSNVTLYYSGDSRWSDNFDDRFLFSSKAKADAVVRNPDGKNGGFKNSTIVSEA